MTNENTTAIDMAILDLHASLEGTIELLKVAREEYSKEYDRTAVSIRGLILAAVRKGNSHVGGREAVDGLRNDLLQIGVLSISDPNRLDDVLNETYDNAYAVGMDAKETYRNIEADWEIELFKAIREASTLTGIFVEKVDVATTKYSDSDVEPVE